jgi:hypothetical protein
MRSRRSSCLAGLAAALAIVVCGCRDEAFAVLVRNDSERDLVARFLSPAGDSATFRVTAGSGGIGLSGFGSFDAWAGGRFEIMSSTCEVLDSVSLSDPHVVISVSDALAIDVLPIAQASESERRTELEGDPTCATGPPSPPP